MIVGIDGSNTRAQGGLTHLKELLAAANPAASGIERVIVWGGAATLAELPDAPWLVRSHQAALDRSLPSRVWWQHTEMPKLAAAHCDVVFVPGGTYVGGYKPFVAMPHNILPFDADAKRLFGLNRTRLRFFLLHRMQQLMFRRASGLIFFTDYSRSVFDAARRSSGRVAEIIPHGLAAEFSHRARQQRRLDEYGPEQPFRWLYVSSVYPYKHPWHVVDAVARLRAEGYPVALDLVGPVRPPFDRGIHRLRRAIVRADPAGAYISFHGAAHYTEMPRWYHRADGFVFASSCENMPITLLEAMAAGLPVACSNRGPMPTILGHAGQYFDPERPPEIAAALRRLMDDPGLRQESATEAARRALKYSWRQTAAHTFALLACVAREHGPAMSTPRSSTPRPAASQQLT